MSWTVPLRGAADRRAVRSRHDGAGAQCFEAASHASTDGRSDPCLPLRTPRPAPAPPSESPRTMNALLLLRSHLGTAYALGVVFLVALALSALRISIPGVSPVFAAFAVRLARRRARASDVRRGRQSPARGERGGGGEVRPDRRHPALDRKTPSDAGERQRRFHRTAERRQFAPDAAVGRRLDSRNRDGAHRRQPPDARQALKCPRPARIVPAPGAAVAQQPRARRGSGDARRGDARSATAAISTRPSPRSWSEPARPATTSVSRLPTSTGSSWSTTDSVISSAIASCGCSRRSWCRTFAGRIAWRASAGKNSR